MLPGSRASTNRQFLTMPNPLLEQLPPAMDANLVRMPRERWQQRIVLRPLCRRRKRLRTPEVPQDRATPTRSSPGKAVLLNPTEHPGDQGEDPTYKRDTDGPTAKQETILDDQMTGPTSTLVE